MQTAAIILLILAVIYLFLRKTAGSYFVIVSFNWHHMYDMMGIDEETRNALRMNKKMEYRSSNANDPDELGIDSRTANFEYYITPNILRNGSYSYSSVYDQQLKQFFETPNISYGEMLSGKTKKGDSLWVGCLFSKHMTNHKAGFSIHFSQTEEDDTSIDPKRTQKTLTVLFEDEYLNLKDIHKNKDSQIPYQAFLITQENNSDPVVKEIQLEKGKFYLNTGIQSVHDAQVSPFASELSKYLKNKKQ